MFEQHPRPWSLEFSRYTGYPRAIHDRDGHMVMSLNFRGSYAATVKGAVLLAQRMVDAYNTAGVIETESNEGRE